MKQLCLAFCLFLLSLSTPTMGQSPYTFHYTNKDIKLSPENFRRYVRPQVRNIVQDFFNTLKKIQPVQGHLVDIMKTIYKLNRSWDFWIHSCRDERDKCEKDLQQVYFQARELDKLLLKFQDSKLSFKDNSKSYHYDAQISLSRSLDNIALMNYQALHLLEEILIVSSTSYALYSRAQKNLSPTLHKMLLRSEMIITGQLDKVYRDDFETVWNNFIKVLEKHVLRERKVDYLLKNLEMLNTSWNSFHMKMTKSKRKLPENSRKPITLMHNRWNSILKVILRN